MGTPSSMDLSSLSTLKSFVRKRTRPIDDDVSMVTPRPTISRLDSDCSMLQLNVSNTPTESDERPHKWRLQSREITDLPEEHKRYVNRLEKDLTYRNTQLELKSKLADKQQDQIKQQEQHIKNQAEQIEDLEDILQAKTLELGGSQAAALKFEHRYKILEKEAEVEKLTRTNIEMKWTELNLHVAKREEEFEDAKNQCLADCQTLHATNDTLQNERNKLEDKVKRLIEGNRALAESKGFAEQAFAQLKETTEQEKKTYQTERNALQSQLDLLKSELEQTSFQFNNKISVLQTEKDSIVARNESSEASVRLLTEQLCSCEKTVSEKASLLSQTAAQLDQIKTLLKNTEDSMAQKDTQLEQALTHINELTAAVSTSEETVKEQEDQMQDLMSETAPLLMEIDELKESLGIEQELVKAKDQRVMELDAEKTQLSLEVERLTEELRVLKESSKERDEENTDIAGDTTCLSTEIQKLTEALHEAEKSVKERDMQITTINAEKIDLSTRCSTLAEALQNKEETVNEKDILLQKALASETELSSALEAARGTIEERDKRLTESSNSNKTLTDLVSQTQTALEKSEVLVKAKDALLIKKEDVLQQRISENSEYTKRLEQLQTAIFLLWTEDDEDVNNARCSLNVDIPDATTALESIQDNAIKLIIGSNEKLITTQCQKTQELCDAFEKLKTDHNECDKKIAALEEKVTNAEIQHVPNSLDWVARGTYDAKIEQMGKLQADFDNARRLHDESTRTLEDRCQEHMTELRDLRGIQTQHNTTLNDMKKLERVCSDLQNKIESFQQCTDPNESQRLHSNIMSQQLHIEMLTNEIHRLRGELNSPGNTRPSSSAPSQTQPRTTTGIQPNGDLIHDLNSVRGLGATLRRAPVVEEMARAANKHPNWALPDLTYQARKPWTNLRGSRFAKPSKVTIDDLELRFSNVNSTGSDFSQTVGGTPGFGIHQHTGGDGRASTHSQTARNPNTAGTSRNGKQPANRDDEADDEQSDDDDDDSFDLLNLQRPTSTNHRLPQGDLYTPSEVRNNTNRLARALFKKAFGVKNVDAIFAKDGVHANILQAFLDKSPDAQQPDIKDARIDKFGLTVKELLRSPWNRTLIHLFAEQARTIALKYEDGRYGASDFNWEGLFRDRMSKALRREVNARPLPGESQEDRILRLANEHDELNRKQGITTMRHIKYRTRADIATIMARVCQERGDQQGLNFWEYVVLVVGILKQDGMSDEEDGEVPMTVGGMTRNHAIKKILVVHWRHPWFRDLFRIVDSAPVVEKILFHRAGHSRIIRLPVNEVTYRAPPTGLPMSVFRPEYLENLYPIDRQDLEISNRDIPVYNFVGFDPNRSSSTQPAGTSGPQPTGTSGSQPAGTSGTQFAGTSSTQPTGTYGTQPAGTSGTQPAGTSGTQPAGTSGTQPAGTSGTQPAGTFGTQPAGTFGTQPAGTFGTQPAGTFGTQPNGMFSTQPNGTFGTQPNGTFGTQPNGTFGMYGTQPAGTFGIYGTQDGMQY